METGLGSWDEYLEGRLNKGEREGGIMKDFEICFGLAD